MLGRRISIPVGVDEWSMDDINAIGTVLDGSTCPCFEQSNRKDRIKPKQG
jgi:hypothetical protein